MLKRLAAYIHLLRVLSRARSGFEFALPVLPILAKYGHYLPAAYLIHRTIHLLTDRALGILQRSICGDDIHVSDDPAAKRAKLRYCTLWRGIWRYLSQISHYDATPTGNLCDWVEHGQSSRSTQFL